MQRILFLAALIFSSMISAAPADTPTESSSDVAKQWLSRMETALNTSNYQLSLVQMQREQIRPMRYHHGVLNGEQVAFLEHLNGSIKSAARVADKVVYLEQDSQPYSVTSNRIPGVVPGAFAGGLLQLQDNYRFVAGGRNRVAGRSAQLIRIVAADQYRYQYRVWIDIDTALPLRVDLVDPNNALLEQMLVIEIHVFGEPLPILSELKAQPWPEVVMAPASKAEHPWRFGWLPQGFEVRHYDQHMLLGLNEPVEYLALTDGLSDFSVYIGRTGKVELPKNITAGNGLSLASAIHGDFEVVVVGKMPVEALANVADNIYPAQE
ncbi:MucB/RseB C-terminal domain-containing protein [uncultured Ferrimonas sp.]|uniref:MucB/RseB C-terminal domain-containing protein n=1 Tax=uncultured Ferrimonas sp. TaxID=432640 RepID=UPI00261E0793|nr:MucB/RseB C-terminal domain-containing protein [uncultured Ferrimonas sp.]